METQKEELTNLLVFDANSKLESEYSSIADSFLKDCDLTFVTELDDFSKKIKSKEFEILVLTESISFDADLLLEFKLLPYNPALIVVSSDASPKDIANLYNHGAERCIIKGEDWKKELGLALRTGERVKKLEKDNYKLLAKLSEANQLLEDRNRRLDEFTGSVAHDIRGPLGSINMRLEYLADMYADKLDERFKNIIDTTLSSNRNLIDIVQAMYEYAKLGTESMKFQRIDLREFLCDVIDDLNVAEDKDVRIGIAELPVVYGVPGLLRKVFYNLFSNSVKYSDKDEIIINIAQVDEEENGLGKFYSFYFQDNGPGIDPMYAKNIFGMFQRGANHRNKEKDGLGVGLAVVNRIMEAHYSRISLNTEFKDGARFDFTLPGEDIDLNA